MYTMICESTNEAAIIDPSCHDRVEWDRLQEHLDGKEVKHILLTHGHADHVSGVVDVMGAFPKASLHLHPLEEENYRVAPEMGIHFGLRIPDNLPEPTHDLKESQIIKIGESIELEVTHTPGHAPGHVAFVDKRPSKDNEGAVMVGGDLLFRGSVGRTDFPNCSLDDLYASLRRLDEMYHDNTIVLSGHTTPTTLETEKETNPFVKFAMDRPREWFDEAKERHGWK
jgi:hydroxyacylglutathione hydrolase